jgi:hypothetical protein
MHKSGHLRGLFQDYLDSKPESDYKTEDGQPLSWLLDQLADCTDILPGMYCSDLDLPRGSTYADAVEVIRGEMAELD